MTKKNKMRNFALKEEWTDAKSAELLKAIDISAKIIQEEIDWEVLSTLLVEKGWTKVNISLDAMYIVEKWVEENIQCKYKVRDTTWLFESEKDAIMFIMRWT